MTSGSSPMSIAVPRRSSSSRTAASAFASLAASPIIISAWRRARSPRGAASTPISSRPPISANGRIPILAPRDTPIEVNSEELFKWGGIANINNWPKDVLEERRRKKIRTRGVGVITHFVKQLLARGVTIKRGTRAISLATENGRVTGVVTDKGRFAATRGVMLACGAYESNPAMAQAYEGLPGFLSMFPPTIDGDGMIMGAELGARIRTIRNNLAVFLGFNIPGKHPGEEPLFRIVGISEMFCPHTIVVNRAGARFADETYFQNMVPSLRHYDVKKHRHANLPCYLIFDQQYIDGFSFIDAPRGSEVPPWVSRANSIEELAGKLEINAAGLATTVARFNGFARNGVDEDFRRGEAAWCLAKKDVWKPTRADETYVSPTLGTLRIPPFYGVELHPERVRFGRARRQRLRAGHQPARPADPRPLRRRQQRRAHRIRRRLSGRLLARLRDDVRLSCRAPHGGNELNRWKNLSFRSTSPD